jgi:dienelactone hydrolase
MKHTMIKISIFIFVLIISCKTETKKEDTFTPKEDPSIELRVGKYMTEEEGAERLKELALNYTTAKDWENRSKAIRENIIRGAELDRISDEEWNYPIKVVSGAKHTMDGYTVENIALEVKPNYFITGNLYKPIEIKKTYPAILSPHGHWFEPNDYGRLRADVQYRSASLAKMGAIVFTYDMVGSGEDNKNIHLEPETLTKQCYNGIRILDYMSSLDFVNSSKIGITGASGGGTQTFLLAALDDRIAVSVPTVMVSAHFYGGCVCESGKPVHKQGDFETNNVEIAASIAPKPLLLIADGDDWTKNVPIVEFPFIQNIYKLFDAVDNVEYAYFKDEVHDYGINKRQPMYRFFAKHLGLNLNKILDKDNKIDETFIKLLDTTQLKVYPDRVLVKKVMSN